MPRERGEGEERTGSSGLVDGNYYMKMDKQQSLNISTENYFQYPVINYNGKEHKKRMYGCVCVILLYNRDWHNTVNQLYFNKNKNKLSVLF